MQWRPFSLSNATLMEICQQGRLILTDGEKTQTVSYDCGAFAVIVNGRRVKAEPVRPQHSEEDINANPHLAFDFGDYDLPVVIDFVPTHWVPESELLATLPQ